MPSTRAWLSTLALGAICTGAAYAIYYRLIVRIGAARAVTVTYLVPLFAVAWAWLLLQEPLTIPMAIAATLILGASRSSQKAAPPPLRWIFAADAVPFVRRYPHAHAAPDLAGANPGTGQQHPMRQDRRAIADHDITHHRRLLTDRRTIADAYRHDAQVPATAVMCEQMHAAADDDIVSDLDQPRIGDDFGVDEGTATDMHAHGAQEPFAERCQRHIRRKV